MVSRDIDYSADAVEAARQVMLEVTRVLGEYADSIVIVGGWVPELLLAATGGAWFNATPLLKYKERT